MKYKNLNGDQVYFVEELEGIGYSNWEEEAKLNGHRDVDSWIIHVIQEVLREEEIRPWDENHKPYKEILKVLRA